MQRHRTKGGEIVQLIGDRFMALDGVRTIDLATGRQVFLAMSRIGSASDEARWAVRCDRLARLRHHAVAELVDYGPLGETRHFEAWCSSRLWTGSAPRAAGAARNGVAFLGACSLTARFNPDLVREWNGRPVWVPDGYSGYDAARTERAGDPGDLDIYGLELVPRRAIDCVTEFLIEADRPCPRAIALRASPGAGVTTAIGDLARTARLNGYVPLGVHCARGSFLRHLEGRTLLLISMEDVSTAWRVLVNCAVRSPRPHRLLVVTHARGDRMPTARLEGVPTDLLIRAIRPTVVDPQIKNRVSSAARRAHGLPARFARLLWGRQLDRKGPGPRSRAAERMPEYAVDQVGDTVPRPCPRPPRPDDPDPGRQRERLLTAVRMLESGRHAPGERALRRAIGGLARRRDWWQATHGALVLCEALLERGQLGAALGSLGHAQEYAARVARQGPTLDLGIVKGRIALARGRLDDAESVLRAVAAAARTRRDVDHEASASLELARCLFWRGRYREASELLPVVLADNPPLEFEVRVMTLSSRLAVGRQDLSTAVSRALEAVERSSRADSSKLSARAWYGAAFAHFSVGDSLAVERDVAAAVKAARRGHDPHTALRARLLLAESDRRRGRTATAASLLARVGRLRASTLPHTIRARCELLSALMSAKAPTAQTVARLSSATGLHALALFAPYAVSSQDAMLRDSVDDVLGILTVCHAPDHATMLARLAAKVRVQLDATSVSIFGMARGDCRLLVRDGGRIGPPGESMARRVVAAGQAIVPHAHADGLEGGAPVRYSGDTLGALVARWASGARVDRPRFTLVMKTAAATAGPGVAEALAHQVVPAGAEELVGVSSAMVDVRKSVERAAASPFSVLVVGESGSGKELVARALHRLSPRRTRPFHTVNCAALPDDLVESELFGHARGAFTGAVSDRPGVFEEAHTGTLFLDEVGELSLRAQAKILRTIQEGELRRVGENAVRRVDVRLVSATNRDLASEVGAGRFRMDLLYRLDVVRIALPPLRERREDIALLVDRYWREATLHVGSRATLAGMTVGMLSAYAWPGNVRELQNVLAALAVRCPNRGAVLPDALPPQLNAHPQRVALRLGEARRTFEEQFVRAALARTGGHRTRAATELGVSRQGLAKLMARLGIDSR